jgi:glycerophosphoryl diester phosphodiesterase
MSKKKKAIIYLWFSVIIILFSVECFKASSGYMTITDHSQNTVASNAHEASSSLVDQDGGTEGKEKVAQKNGKNEDTKGSSSAEAAGENSYLDVETDEPEEEERDENWYAAEHIISHRGASGEEVEHTFAAYDLAIEYGSHYIEQDLVLSKEGTLYVSHDDSAERIAGVDRMFADMTDQEIDQLRTENGEKIHTLQEVFDRYGKDTTYVIELKDGGSQIDYFIDIIQTNGMEDHVIVQDFEPEPLEKLEYIFPDMPKLRLCREESDLLNGINDYYSDIICVKYTLLSQENCDRVHSAGKAYAVYWSGKASEDVPNAIDIGVDYYFTNYTKEAMELEKSLRVEK